MDLSGLFIPVIAAMLIVGLAGLFLVPPMISKIDDKGNVGPFRLG